VAIITTQVTIITAIVTNNSQDMVFAATSKTENFIIDIWICNSKGCGHYCISEKVFLCERDQ
jgi:hypothetical protein